MKTILTMDNAFLKFILSIIIFSGFIQTSAQANDESRILDRPADSIGSLFHVGLWVEDVDEMLSFLSEVMEYEIIYRADRRSGGERLMLSDHHGQLIELLSDPDNVKAHPEFPLHPVGRVAGIAHLSIQVEDVALLKKKMLSLGYKSLAQVPEDYADGYLNAGDKRYRILFIQGPGAVSFEFFEIKK